MRLTAALLLIFFGQIAAAAQVWPEAGMLSASTRLPDPFEMRDGRRVTSWPAWDLRRTELKSLLQFYEYGHLPPPSGDVGAIELSRRAVFNGAGEERQVSLRIGREPALAMRASLIVPAGRGPFPVVIKSDASLGNVPIAEELVRDGYIVVEYVATDLDPDERDVIGPAQAAYPDYDWATLAVWAWGGMRVMDYLLTLEIVDPARIAVTGHSRGGKAALLHGALDERVALTAPNGSGAGGAGSYRHQGEGAETLELITRPGRFGYWFQPRLRAFAGKEDRLPFDQHFLKALVAPRALLCTEAREDLWANPSGTALSSAAAEKVFEFLGRPDRNALSTREGKHDQTREDWLTLWEFMNVQFRGKESKRDFKQFAAAGALWEEPVLNPTRVLRHVPIYQFPGRYAGWPANHGLWSWENEILAGFSVGYFKDLGPDRHAIDRDRPEEHWLARSRDGGESWTLEHPGSRGQLVPRGEALHGQPPAYLPEPQVAPWPGVLDFSAPGFAMALRMADNNVGPSFLHYSSDRGRTWQGPFRFPDLGTPGIAARTDYLVNGPHDCQAFLTCAKADGREGRVLCARTTDGGRSWHRQSYIGPEPPGFAIMPSTARVSATELVTAVRRREGTRRWIDAYRSADNGESWQPLPVPVPDAGEGNPPSLIRLRDGRLCLTYGYRAKPFSVRAKLSADNGSTWGDDIVLREEGGGRDLGYPCSAQRPDGAVVVVYYFHDEPKSDRYVAATIWRP